MTLVNFHDEADDWTYPEIQPKLIEETERRISGYTI